MMGYMNILRVIVGLKKVIVLMLSYLNVKMGENFPGMMLVKKYICLGMFQINAMCILIKCL